MTLRLLDGFDDLGSLSERYDGVSKASLQTAPWGGKMVKIDNDGYLRYRFPQDSTEDVIVGVRLKFNPYYRGAEGDNRLILIGNRYGSTDYVHFIVGVRQDMVLTVWRGYNKNGFSSRLGSAPEALRDDKWYYLEVRGFVSSTSGCVLLLLNGVEVLRLTGVNTYGSFVSGPAAWDQVRLYSDGGTFGRVYYDDFYICDGAGTENNDFLGQIRIPVLLPGGSGYYSGWTASPGGSPNYAHVDEVPHDGDTSYVETSASGTKDSYVYQDLGAPTGSVYGGAVWIAGSGTAASVRGMARLGGSDSFYETVEINGGYTYEPSIFQRSEKPGGGQWTPTDVDNAEFGIELVG